MYRHSKPIKSPSATSAANLSRVVGFLMPYWPRLTLILATVGVAALLCLLPPLIVRRIIDGAIEGLDRGLLTWLSLAAVVVAVGGKRIMYDLKVLVYRRLQSLSLPFFTSNRTGERISRLTSDIAGIDNVISGTLVSIVSNLVTLASTAVAMAAMSWTPTRSGSFRRP